MAPRQPGKQMMLELELQPSEEPVHPRRAIDVDGSCSLLLEPVVPLWGTHVDVGGKMVERELDVLNGADAEAGQNKEDSLRPVRQAGDEEREPSPENHDSENVESSVWDLSVG